MLLILNLTGQQPVINVTENLNFARIYWEVILSIYNEVSSFLSTINELSGSLSFKLLNSNVHSSEVQHFNQALIEKGIKYFAKIIQILN